MKTRSLLAFTLVLSLAFVPTIQLALAASSTTTSTTTTSASSVPHSPFSERLDIYLAGSSGYSLVTLNPVNVTKAGVVAAESVSGVSAYELTAVKTTSASASAQLFWGDGYRVLKLPFMPQSGVFLNVTASSQSAAQSAATDFNSYLGTNFVQTGSSGSNYTFFSPADFTVAGEIIYSSVPIAEKGLSAITSPSTLATTPTPTAILTGVRSGTAFTHTLSFGSIETGVLATNGSLNLAKAINQANASFTSSPTATSTQVVLHVLDGLITSNDGAKINNDQASFSGTYSIGVSPNTRFRPNVTIVQDPPVLTASRLLDRGSASSGDLVSVTLLLKNTAQSGALQNIAVNDNWWNSYSSLFSLTAGNSTLSGLTLSAGQNITRVYVLKVTSTASQDLTLPAAKVTYSYTVGATPVTGSTKTNQDELRTNSIGPALMIQAGVDESSGSAIGKTGHYIMTVTNIGNGPALNLQLANLTNPNLSQGGAVWKVNTSLPFTSILSRNLTRTFTVGWTAPDGSKASLISNPATILLSHIGILLPLSQFSISATLTPIVLRSGTVNATYTLSNTGNSVLTSANATERFANGMICEKVLNGNATCSSSSFSLITGTIAPGASVQGRLLMNFSSDNYLTEPAMITTTFGGVTLHTAGAAFIVPAGVVVTRSDSPNPVFARQNETVTVKVVNQGSLSVINASVKTNPDVFDKALSGLLHQAWATLSPSSTQSFNYTVQALAPGNHTTSPITLSFAFAGFTAAYTVYPGNVVVYKDVQATTSTRPATPVEGAGFTLFVNVQNPSAVDVTNVLVSIPIPRGLSIANASSGLSVLGRSLSFSIPSLPAGAVSTRSVTLRAGSDGTINLSNGSLSFQYLGQTIQGVVSTPPIVVGVDLLVRYELPIAGAVVLTLVVALYMHRKLTVTPPK